MIVARDQSLSSDGSHSQTEAFHKAIAQQFFGDVQKAA
jgi:hypothetical protein